MAIVYKTLKKSHVAIVKQPFMHRELDSKGKLKRKRQVQYVETLDSIYVDEQIKIDKDARPTALYLKKGIFKSDDERIIEMMDINPDNEANGGKLFRKVEVEKEEIFQVEQFEKLDNLKMLIMKADENTLRAAAVFFINMSYVKKSTSALKLKLRSIAELASHNPEDPMHLMDRLTEHFTSKNNDAKLVVAISLKEDIIKLGADKRVMWADSNEVIFIGSQQKDTIKEFAVYLETDEKGRQVLSILAKKVKSLKTK